VIHSLSCIIIIIKPLFCQLEEQSSTAGGALLTDDTLYCCVSGCTYPSKPYQIA
jgi:hypothetical protein